jgi:hypothetical protein
MLTALVIRITAAAFHVHGSQCFTADSFALCSSVIFTANIVRSKRPSPPRSQQEHLDCSPPLYAAARTPDRAQCATTLDSVALEGLKEVDHLLFRLEPRAHRQRS